MADYPNINFWDENDRGQFNMQISGDYVTAESAIVAFVQSQLSQVAGIGDLHGNKTEMIITSTAL